MMEYVTDKDTRKAQQLKSKVDIMSVINELEIRIFVNYIQRGYTEDDADRETFEFISELTGLSFAELHDLYDLYERR